MTESIQCTHTSLPHSEYLFFSLVPHLSESVTLLINKVCALCVHMVYVCIYVCVYVCSECTVVVPFFPIVASFFLRLLPLYASWESSRSYASNWLTMLDKGTQR